MELLVRTFVATPFEMLRDNLRAIATYIYSMTSRDLNCKLRFQSMSWMSLAAIRPRWLRSVCVNSILPGGIEKYLSLLPLIILERIAEINSTKVLIVVSDPNV